MKIAIRKGVFETNSSSTHSFTICKNENSKKIFSDSEWDNDVNIVSAEEKIIWFMGMLANAEEVYNYPVSIEERKEREESKRFLAKANLKDLGITFKDLGFDSEEDYFSSLKDEEIDSKEEMIWLLEGLIEYYCKQKSLTKKQAMDYFYSLNAKAPLDGESKFKYSKKFCASCSDKEFDCCRYFNEGALIDCFCGYEDYDAMSYSLGKLKEKFGSWEKFVEWFLSDDCKIVAIERY